MEQTHAAHSTLSLPPPGKNRASVTCPPLTYHLVLVLLEKVAARAHHDGHLLIHDAEELVRDVWVGPLSDERLQCERQELDFERP